MTLDEFLAFMDSGATLEGESEIHQMMHQLAEEAIRICNDLNSCDRKPETIQALFSALTGREVDASVRFFPPIFCDCGKNLKLGKGVFLNSGVKIQDQGGVTIDDGALIGHNTVIATLNHLQDPARRGGMSGGRCTSARMSGSAQTPPSCLASPSATAPSWQPAPS